MNNRSSLKIYFAPEDMEQDICVHVNYFSHINLEIVKKKIFGRVQHILRSIIFNH